MKQIFFLLFIAISMVVFSSSQTFAQDSESSIELKKIGLGLHIEQFKLTDISMDMSTSPANKMVLTITPTNNFRLEPEIGFSYFNDKENELKDKSIQIGIGVYGMFQRGKTNFYGGLKFEYANISNEYYDWSHTGDKQTEKINRLGVGPTIGAEFFFGEHFSFGGEIGLKYMNLKSDNSQYDEDNKLDYITTESGLLLRFYF